MAELNFGLLTPPGSQSIGNAFAQGMDQAAVARAQENQNALAQYTLGKAKREDELNTQLLGDLRSATTNDEIYRAYQRAGKGDVASKLRGEQLTQDKTRLEIAGLPLTQANTKAQTAVRHGTVMKNEATRVLADPTFDNAMQAVVNFGKATGQDVTQELATITAIGNDSVKIANWAKGHAVTGEQLLNQNKPQSPVGKANADLKAAIENGAPPAEIAALTAARDSALVGQQQGAQRIDISRGQLGVAQGNLAVNQARLELQKNAPKLGLVDPEDIDRVAVAVASGRVPVDRLNSTTAPMFAKLLKTNPDLDFTKLSITQAGDRTAYTTSARTAARQTLTDVDATRAENIAKGNLPPATGLNADKIMNAVIAINPNYNVRDFGLQTSAEKSFNTGKQGDKTRSLNVAVSHLGTLDTAAAALRSGDIRVFNQFKQAWQRETGKTAPTDFNAVRELVADEIVAAVVPGVGALADRKALKDTIMAKSSPAQLQGVIKQYKELLGGQLGGLEKQYNASTSKTDFKQRYLTPEAIAALTPGQNAPPAGAASTATNTNPYAAKTNDEILRALEGK